MPKIFETTPKVQPLFDIYEMIVHRLCNDDITKQEQIWNLDEEVVYRMLYLRRVDAINSSE
ncbi:MAG: hypothetical protein H3C35_08550 [Bacteroidetes bacterium]|nr:hypothetical protein [Bacteroidota bacterium]